MKNPIKNGGPAFPFEFHYDEKQTSLRCDGMTLRCYIAAKAMQGELSAQGNIGGNYASGQGVKDLVKFSVECADALIAELSKEPNK